LLIAAICIFNVNAEEKTTKLTGEGEGSGDGIVGVVVKTTKSMAAVAIGEKTMKVADITGITAGDELTIGVSPNAEKMTVKSVTADKRQRRAAAVPGTIEFTGKFTKDHGIGAAIEWTVATKTKSSAVTTTVGVGIFAMVAALF